MDERSFNQFRNDSMDPKDSTTVRQQEISLADMGMTSMGSEQEFDDSITSEASTSFSSEDLLLRSFSGKKRFKNRFLILAKLGTTVKKQLESFFRSEIRQRALVTLLMLIAMRAGHFIPLPGFDRRFMPGDYLVYPTGA